MKPIEPESRARRGRLVPVLLSLVLCLGAPATLDAVAEPASPAEEAYERGQKQLDRSRWRSAAEEFERAIQFGGERRDGAMYWLGYSLYKQAEYAHALQIFEKMQAAHPSSSWLDQARELEFVIRQELDPDFAPRDLDEELKMVALHGLLLTDPERALPQLEKILHGDGSTELREQALFLLLQTGYPRALEITSGIAREGSDPELRLQAIHQLAMIGGDEGAAVLAEIYRSSKDVEVRRAVLDGYMMTGEKERILEVARSDSDPELRMDAIRLLGAIGAESELAALFRDSDSDQVKQAVIEGWTMSGNTDRLVAVAKGNERPEVRAAAIIGLCMTSSEDHSRLLRSLYGELEDRDVRMAIVQALGMNGNTAALIEMARQESDPEMKIEIVRALAMSQSKEATEYLLEILEE